MKRRIFRMRKIVLMYAGLYHRQTLLPLWHDLER